MAEDRLNLLSRSVTEDELQQASRDCVYATVRLVWNMVRFPANNKVVIQSSATWKHAMRQVLLLRNSFVVAVIGRNLAVEGVRLEADDEMIGHFVDELNQRRIRKIVFWQGITDDEIGYFAELMGGKPADLLEKGGPVTLLRQRGARHINVIQSQQPETQRQAAEQKAHWEGKLDQMGLDKGEVVALLSGRGRLSRFLTTEVQLLVEAMQDPQFLSELLVRVAMEASGNKGPDPAELRRVCERAQYILVVNSGFEPSESPRILARAVQAFERRHRLGLLGEKLRLQRSGQAIADERIFAFEPDEYAEHFVRALETDGDWAAHAEGLWWDSTTAEAVADAFVERLQTAASVSYSAEQARAEADRLRDALSAAPQALAGDEETEPPSVPVGDAAEALRSRAAEFTHDLTEGYTYTLLYLYEYAAPTKDRAAELFERLTIILEARMAMDRIDEAAALLGAMLHEQLPQQTAETLREQLRASLSDEHAEALIDHAAKQLARGDKQALETARVLTDLYGQRVWERAFGLLLEHEEGVPPKEVVGLLGEHAEQLMPVLQNSIKDEDPAKRVRAVELLALFEEPSFVDMALSGIRDRNRHVRLLSLFALGHATSRRVVPALLRVARGDDGNPSEQERCAAIWALGQQRAKEAIDTLGEEIAHRNWFRRKPRADRRAFAAKALHRIRSPAAIETLGRHAAQLNQTRFEKTRRAVSATVDRAMLGTGTTLLRGVRGMAAPLRPLTGILGGKRGSDRENGS